MAKIQSSASSQSDLAPALDQLQSFEVASCAMLIKRGLLHRSEDKFILATEDLEAFLKVMASSYQIILSAGERLTQYGTTYLDTDDLGIYRYGTTNTLRQKVRLRRYPQRNLCFLEVKSKRPDGSSSKVRLKRPMESVELQPEEHQFIQSHLSHYEPLLSPQVVVQYCRISFLSKASMERMTVDFNIRYSHNRRVSHLGSSVVIEVKRPPSKPTSIAYDWLHKNGLSPAAFSKFKFGLWLQGHQFPVDVTPWTVTINDHPSEPCPQL